MDARVVTAPDVATVLDGNALCQYLVTDASPQDYSSIALAAIRLDLSTEMSPTPFLFELSVDHSTVWPAPGGQIDDAVRCLDAHRLPRQIIASSDVG